MIALLNPKYSTDVLSLVRCILPEVEMGYTLIHQKKIVFTSTRREPLRVCLLLEDVSEDFQPSFILVVLFLFCTILERCSVYYIQHHVLAHQTLKKNSINCISIGLNVHWC
jgi:hypothetical protein